MMSKNLKKLIFILMIFSAAMIFAAGILGITYFINKPEPSVQKSDDSYAMVDLETQVDIEVTKAGKNYTDSKIVDGRFTRTFYTGNVKYLADNGSYQPIDTTVIASAGDFSYENTTNVYKTYFQGNSTSDNFIKFEMGDRSVVFSFVEANDSTPVTEANTIIYPDVYQGLDAKYTISSERLLEELIAEKEVTTIDKISQKIKLSGVYYKEQPDGSITFHDESTKKIVFVIPRPVMYEQNEPSNNNFGLHYEIKEGGGGGYIISKIIDQEGKEWLAGANYPVVIDTTILPFNGNSNLEGEIENNFTLGYVAQTGNDITTAITGIRRMAGGWFDYYRTFLSFDTSSLGQATVESATLTAYMRRTSSLDDLPTNDIQVWSGADLWTVLSENVATWDAYLAGVQEETIETDGLGFQVSDCTGNPSQCERMVNINVNSVSGSGNTQIVFEESLISQVNTGIWVRYAITFLSQYSTLALRPTLEVEVVLDRPNLSIAPPTVEGQLVVALNDNSDDEDWWNVERSLDGTSGWQFVCGMVPGLSGSCPQAGDTYDCSGASQAGYFSGGICNGLGGATTCQCVFTDNNLNSNIRYYYRSYAERDQDF